MAYSQLGLMSQAPNNGVPHTTWFTRDNEGTLVAMLDRNDATKNRYYVFDGLGSVVATTDSSGNVIRRYRYEPYGEEIGPSPTDGNPWRFASGYFEQGDRHAQVRHPLLHAGSDPLDPARSGRGGANRPDVPQLIPLCERQSLQQQ